MEIIKSVKSMQKSTRAIVSNGKTIGLVPTMGFLHDGHYSLIKKMANQVDRVVISIFVNPTQFGPTEDLAAYPRDIKKDLAGIEECLGKKSKHAIVFIPKAEDIYSEDFQTWVTVENLTKILEGKHRPGHFRGVTTVVAKFFNIVRPDVAIFGMKDFQQAAVLKQMTKDLGYPVKFMIGPTKREPDGLAMSSRNSYFNNTQRWEAVCLYYALQSAKEMVKAGILDTEKIKKEMVAVIKATCSTARIEYISFNLFKDLQEVKKVVPGTVCSLSVKVYEVRLIDNMKLM